MSTTFEGFSLSHAAILDGTTGLEETDGDIYGIREGSLEVNIDSYDNVGDDSVLSSWNWFNFAVVRVTAGYIPFKLIALLTGDTVTSSGAAPNDQYEMPLWSEGSLNTPRRPMYLRVPAKDEDGTERALEIVLYNVQFEPMNFNGPTYKDGLLVSYQGKALMSDTDEAGQTLADRAIGRLISSPAGTIN